MNKEKIKIATVESELQQIYRIVNNDIYKYFALFEHMADEHNLTLLESELQQIYRIVNNDLDTENQQLTQKLIKTQNHYEAVVQQNKELQQESRTLKDEILSLMTTQTRQLNGFEKPKTFLGKPFEYWLQIIHQLEVFNDDYFNNLTYEAIAELAKKSIRLTTENCEMQHKIKDYIENQCSNCEETSEHCEFCDIQDLKKIIGGEDDTAN